MKIEVKLEFYMADPTGPVGERISALDVLLPILDAVKESELPITLTGAFTETIDDKKQIHPGGVVYRADQVTDKKFGER